MLSENKKGKLREFLQEKLHREFDSLKLYKPLPAQKQFHKSKSFFRIARGGNRAGKTLACAAEVARAARGEHPYFGKKPLDIYIVVDKEDHIGRVIYDKLFRHGPFKVIEDKGAWRAFDPLTDAGKEGQALPAEPLIPLRFIESVSWHNRGTRAFQVVRLRPLDPSWHRGTEIWAFSGVGSAPQGQAVDLVWIDEDLRDPDFVGEMIVRCPDRGGRIIWSAFPHNDNDALLNASEQASKGNPQYEEILLGFLENRYIAEDAKQQTVQSLSYSPEELNARIFGQFIASALMYPMFHKGTHVFPRDGGLSTLDRFLAQGVPDNWTKYLAIDPGHTVAFAVAGAVPPPEFGDFLVLFGEVEVREATAQTFAKAVANKFGGHAWQSFIIDDHGSRGTEAGSGLTIRAQYAQAFKDNGLKSQFTGHNFVAGSDDRAGRAALVRTLLTIDGPTGAPRLAVLHGACPLLTDHFRRYRKKITKDQAQDVADPRSPWGHSMNAIEYLCAYQPRYYKPKPFEKIYPILQEKEEWDKYMKFHKGPAGYHLGPGSGRAS